MYYKWDTPKYIYNYEIRKPDWTKLMVKYHRNNSVLVGEINCTAVEQQDLCKEVGTFHNSEPIIKHGSSKYLELYHGEHFLANMTAHVHNLHGLCSVTDKTSCNVHQLYVISILEKNSVAELEKYMDGTQKKHDMIKDHAVQTVTNTTLALKGAMQKYSLMMEEIQRRVQLSLIKQMFAVRTNKEL